MDRAVATTIMNMQHRVTGVDKEKLSAIIGDESAPDGLPGKGA
jgi:hypothetical protein